MKTIQLNNGIVIPTPGLGTYRLGRNDREVIHAVRNALDAGYRHIDTASFYDNEYPIGKAIAESRVPREELFVTTKLWGTDILKNGIEQAFEESMLKLDIGYIDLYLVHWPVTGQVAATWRKMEQIYESGRVRAIGVSNHLTHHLEELLSVAAVVPAVNQVELHPYLVMQGLQDYCREKDIVVESWSPLGSSKIPLLADPLLLEIGQRHSRSTAQVILRWNLQKGLLPLPKSSDAKRQKENIALFDFSLSGEEISLIDRLDKGERTGVHPDEIEF
ncbi:MAG: aldo/keto reductase [Proteiniphilum sp.]|jgi:diketogulonate reductase-like aldo/keto reductase|nr:aldo/keto reductase [Proteiniphilum sp.]NCD13725.1 aldo/keto reductase [Bacteroidia bacterium]HHT34032.1 aldo/keto reductase [Bacteroidales bacterium]MDD2725786.1 aldo/keto reductase [Proteiniphilum sp.]MDD3331820.1 aldo/keto reductase [Proteiniphilum sp.]